MSSGNNPHPVLKEYYEREADRPRFVSDLFDRTARQYELVSSLLSFGSGRFYRARVLRQQGLRPGMRVLDVATGTGLVARAAAEIVGRDRVVGLDASAGMLREARRTGSLPLVQGRAEELPFLDARFDLVTMGYALRHVADLRTTFAEFLRILKPQGRLVILEIVRPESVVFRRVVRAHLETVVPAIVRTLGGGPDVSVLTRYLWNTVAQCVPPRTIVEVLRASGFGPVTNRSHIGLLAEYVAVRPAETGGGAR